MTTAMSPLSKKAPVWVKVCAFGALFCALFVGAVVGGYVAEGLLTGLKWEPIVVSIECDDAVITTVTPPSHLNSYYPSIEISGKTKGVTWYDASNTKTWLDVSHCGTVKIKPWKLAKPMEKPSSLVRPKV